VVITRVRVAPSKEQCNTGNDKTAIDGLIALPPVVQDYLR